MRKQCHGGDEKPLAVNKQNHLRQSACNLWCLNIALRPNFNIKMKWSLNQKSAWASWIHVWHVLFPTAHAEASSCACGSYFLQVLWWFTCRQQAEFSQLEQAKISIRALMTLSNTWGWFRETNMIGGYNYISLLYTASCPMATGALTSAHRSTSDTSMLSDAGITSISSATVRWDMLQRRPTCIHGLQHI